MIEVQKANSTCLVNIHADKRISHFAALMMKPWAEFLHSPLRDGCSMFESVGRAASPHKRACSHFCFVRISTNNILHEEIDSVPGGEDLANRLLGLQVFFGVGEV